VSRPNQPQTRASIGRYDFARWHSQVVDAALSCGLVRGSPSKQARRRRVSPAHGLGLCLGSSPEIPGLAGFGSFVRPGAPVFSARDTFRIAHAKITAARCCLATVRAAPLLEPVGILVQSEPRPASVAHACVPTISRGAATARSGARDVCHELTFLEASVACPRASAVNCTYVQYYPERPS
jgi:hypothetical protein